MVRWSSLVVLRSSASDIVYFFFFQAEDGIRDVAVTGVQTCALPVLDARAKGPEGAGPDGTLGLSQGLEQRAPERLDLPARELPDRGEPGAIVWRRLGAGDRLEDRAPAQHAGIERQLRGGPIANRLEALDPRLDRRIARLSWGALHAGELAFRQRECALHAIEQRGSVTCGQAGRQRRDPPQLGGPAGHGPGHGPDGRLPREAGRRPHLPRRHPPTPPGQLPGRRALSRPEPPR